MNIQGFVITLERARERKSQVARIRAMSPVPCEELTAVDGSLLTAEERNGYMIRQRYWPRYPFQLRTGEIGVFLSHRKAWQQIVDRDLDGGLIIEDDVELEPAIFAQGFQLAASHLKPYQIYKFSIKSGPLHSHPLAAEPVSIRKPWVVPLGAQAQLVEKNAAQRLLTLTNQFDRPIDSFLQLSWLTGVETILVEPSGVTEISGKLGGSTIQLKQRPRRETLYRNLVRPVYRSQIRLMSSWNTMVP